MLSTYVRSVIPQLPAIPYICYANAAMRKLVTIAVAVLLWVGNTAFSADYQEG